MQSVKTLHPTGQPSLLTDSFLRRHVSQRAVLGQAERASRGSARSAQRGGRETPCRLTLDAAGAHVGRREETQITEVAAQKGNLQNGGCRKSSVLSCIFYLPGGGGEKQCLPQFCLLWWWITVRSFWVSFSWHQSWSLAFEVTFLRFEMGV